MEIKKNVLSPEEYHRLFTSVGWEAPSIEQIKAALEHSLCTFSVCDGERVIGMARLLGDSAMTFYIKDLAAEKGYQGRGAGKLLMESIQEYIESQLPEGWKAGVELMSVKGKEEFYKRFAFEEWDGTGMIYMAGR